MSAPNTPIIRHLGGSEYEIESESGQTYFMDADLCRCSCPSWKFRCSETPGKRCKHLDLLAELLKAQQACPVCKGKGWFQVSFCHAVTGWDPWACVMCEGTGRRDGWVPSQLAWHDECEAREQAEAEQAMLRDLFA